MAGSTVSKPVIGAVAGVGAGLLPGAFPSGVGLSHVSEGFVWPHGGASVLERGVGVRDFSGVPKPFRSFESECSGYVWDASVSGWSGSVFTHGGFSFGVTPRARWSFGGSVDLNAVADGFRVPVAGAGARALGESAGVEDLFWGVLLRRRVPVLVLWGSLLVLVFLICLLLGLIMTGGAALCRLLKFLMFWLLSSLLIG